MPDRNVCHWVLACPLNRAASLRSVALAGLRVVLYGCVAEWLALRCAHGSPPDGCWDSGGHRAENPIKLQFQALALRRWSAPARQGTQAKPFCTSIIPQPQSLHAPLSFLSSSLSSPFSSFYRGRLQAQPARIWSVALGVCGPRLLNKGADWLIDRPSPVPAPHMFPGSLPYIRIFCWPGLR